jgi:ABC-type multidrug transport system fused ATPase/permease subunit
MFIREEEKADGPISWNVYKYYLSASKSNMLLTLIALSYAFSSVFQSLQMWVISSWTNDLQYQKRSINVYLSSIAFLAFSSVFFNWIRSYYGQVVGVYASATIHTNLLQRILSAPLNYFECIPSGRFFQLLSKDFDAVDVQLPVSIGKTITAILTLVSSLVSMILVTPLFSVCIAPLILVYITLTNYYLNTSRQLKRLESITRAPILSHIDDTISGVSVIRSFHKEDDMLTKHNKNLNDNIYVYYCKKLVDRWLSVRLETLGNILVLVSSTLLLVNYNTAHSGHIGLSLNNALGITNTLNWAVRSVTDTESLMNSVERIYNISENIPIEYSNAMDKTFLNKPSYSYVENHLQLNETTQQWPVFGSVEFSNVTMRYRSDMPIVLRNVSFKINPGERVAIIGPTGKKVHSICSLHACFHRSNYIYSSFLLHRLRKIFYF